MDPIGASSSWRWYGYEKSKIAVGGSIISSVSGGGHFGGGLFINSLDHARFGLLFLRNGKWKNELLLNPEWIKLVQQPSENNESYGYMWWLNRGARKWKDYPKTFIMALGLEAIILLYSQPQIGNCCKMDRLSSKIGEFVVINSQKN